MKRLMTSWGFRLLLFFFLLQGAGPLAAQPAAADADAFRWRLIGRVFFDGGVFMNDTLGLGNAVQVNDIRLGTVVNIGDRWEAKIELGFDNGKVGFKDIFLSYNWDRHSLRLGHQYEPSGYARMGTANYHFMQNATADNALGEGRKLGLSYSYDREWLNVMAGVYSGGGIRGDAKVDEGYSLAAKVVGRPYMRDGRLVHIAVAPRFADGQESVAFAGGVPTALLDKGDNNFLGTTVGSVTNRWKWDVECILLYGKWYLQGQYFLAHLNRHGAENFNGKGGYVQAGYLILGDKYKYNAKTAMMGNPSPKTLALLVRYDHVDLNDAGVQGGKLSDITVGVNYYINKYIAAKINYTRMMPDGTSPLGGKDFDLLQGRVQFSF